MKIALEMLHGIFEGACTYGCSEAGIYPGLFGYSRTGSSSPQNALNILTFLSPPGPLSFGSLKIIDTISADQIQIDTFRYLGLAELK